jgi:hypothetical protein
MTGKNSNYQGGMLARNIGLEMRVSGCQGVKRKTSSVGCCVAMPASHGFIDVYMIKQGGSDTIKDNVEHPPTGHGGSESD